MTFVGLPKLNGAVAGKDESGVTEPSLSVGSHDTVAVFVPLPGFDENVQSYGYRAVSPALSVPPAGSRLWFTSVCTVQVPPTSVESVTVTLFAFPVALFVTVILPLTFQPLSLPESWLTLTV